MKVYSYLRVSSKGQLDGDGIDRQRESIAKWAKSNRHTVVEEFSEEGISGCSDALTRPAISRMVEAMTVSGIKTVVVERPDRISRDIIVSELLLREWQRAGISVWSADGNQDISEGDADNPTAKMIRQILAVISEFDRCQLVLKMRLAREKIRRETGVCEGRKPFGHTPEEQATIKRMRELRRKPKGGTALSLRKIARILDDEGHKTRMGKPWSAMSVRQILNA